MGEKERERPLKKIKESGVRTRKRRDERNGNPAIQPSAENAANAQRKF